MSSDAANVLYCGRTNLELYAAVIKDLSSFYSLDQPTNDVARSPYIMSVNCLQHQSISFVRNNLAFFAKMIIKVPKGLRKTVILRDADFLSAEAQAALRRSIEVNNHTTRFIITTKRFGGIQDPILSRFKTVNVSPIIKDPATKLVKSLSNMSSAQLIQEVDRLIANGRTRGITDNSRQHISSYTICLNREGCRCDYLISLYATLVRRHD